MLRYITRYHTFGFVSAIAFPIVLMQFYSPTTFVSSLVFFLAWIGFIALSVFFGTLLASLEYRRIMKIITEKIDPKRFLKAQKSMYRKARRRMLIDSDAATICLIRAVALGDLGESEAAFKEQSGLLDSSISRIRAAAHADLALICASGADKDISAAREHLATARSLTEQCEKPIRTPADLDRVEYVLDIAEGKNLEATLDYFSAQLDSAPNRRAKCVTSHYLAEICRQSGDTGQERHHLEFVAQNASRAHIGKLAAARLTELSA